MSRAMALHAVPKPGQCMCALSATLVRKSAARPYKVLQHVSEGSRLRDSRIQSQYTASTSQHQPDFFTTSSTSRWQHGHQQPVAEVAEQLSHDMPTYSRDSYSQAQSIGIPPPAPTPPPPRGGRGWLTWFGLGAITAVVLQFVIGWLLVSPVWERFFGRFVWNRGERSATPPQAAAAGMPATESTALVLYSDTAETVEWVNMMWRKAWRVYQRGLERWLADLLQPVFDNLIADESVPRFVQRLRILEFTLDHEAPYFDNMRRRSSRKDSDLNGVVDVRYTGGAKMLLQLEVGQGRWRIKIPVLVSDLDLECQLWLKIRLAPMTPYFGTIALAFVGSPTIKVQLLPYNRVRLMRVPIVQAFLTHLLTVDLPSLMVLPKRLEINIPPAVTAVAEAAVGRDVVMKAVASAVLQADALENALIAALPLGPQSAAGGVSLPDTFQGELQVNLVEARNLAVWGFPWQSNPYCRLSLGSQVVRSRKDAATSHRGSHKAPVWNQEFHFLVTDHATQVLEIAIRDSRITGRAGVGVVQIPLKRLSVGGQQNVWLPVQASAAGLKASGELHVELTYRQFEDDDADSGYREAEAYALALQQHAITDYKSAADASSRAAVAASAAAAAVAVTKAAAARAATKAAVANRAAARNKKQARLAKTAKSPSGTPQESGARASSIDGTDNSTISAKDLEDMRHIEEQFLKDAGASATSLEDLQSSSIDMAASNSDEVEVRDRATARRNFKRINSMQRQQLGLAGQPLPEAPMPDGITADQLFPGIEFRVTEEYDEDSPFSRPPSQPKPKAGPSADPKADAPAPAPQDATHATTRDDNQQGNGTSPALTPDPLTSITESTIDTTVAQLQSHKQASSQPETQTGRHQIASDAPAPDSIAEGIEFADRPDDDQPASTDFMDPVNKKPGVKRILDGQGRKAPSRSPSEQGLLPHPERQTKQDLEAEGSSGSTQQGQTDTAKEKPWWESAADSAVGAFESTKSAILGGIESVTKGQGDKQATASKSSMSMSSQDEALDDVVLSPDLPLEAIAEEMQNTWHLKEVQVERLMEKAVAQSERPWLILLTTVSCVSIVLLTLILLRLQQGGHL